MRILSRVAGMMMIAASAVGAQMRPVLTLAPEAKRQIDSLVIESITMWQERQACVGQWRYRGDTIVVEKVIKDPAFAYADSEHTYSYKVVQLGGGIKATECFDKLPVLHTHLPTRAGLWDTREVSEIDWKSLEDRPEMPFALLVAIRDKQGRYAVGAYFTKEKP